MEPHRLPRSTLFPYTTLFRSTAADPAADRGGAGRSARPHGLRARIVGGDRDRPGARAVVAGAERLSRAVAACCSVAGALDRVRGPGRRGGGDMAVHPLPVADGAPPRRVAPRAAGEIAHRR